MSADVLLHLASSTQLIAELKRRLDQPSVELEPPTAWCDDCVHFRASPTADVRYNPCTKRHVMAFYCPQEHDSPETFGFYREGCADRIERPETIDATPSVSRSIALRLTPEHPEYRQAPPPRGGKPRPV